MDLSPDQVRGTARAPSLGLVEDVPVDSLDRQLELLRQDPDENEQVHDCPLCHLEPGKCVKTSDTVANDLSLGQKLRTISHPRERR